MPTWRLLTLALVITMLALAAACGGDGDAPPNTPTSAATAAASATVSPAPSATATEAPPPTPAPTSNPIAPLVLRRGDPARREIALTFDAGSDPGFTQDILRTLYTESIRASFAVTGLWAEANPDLLRAIAADGHVLMNHTYNHRSFTGLSTDTPPLSPDLRALELSRVETTVYRLSSRTTRPYFRPPFGDYDDSVVTDAAAAGFPVIVMWTIDTLGWNAATADAIVERTLSLAEPGAIVIMHVGSESQDAAALQRVIDGLRADGYVFVTIEDMVAPR
jgi:peptidoglycan/xylan/chitin deacetylase (PgdA/CDA1 family)